jgi:hypothetical protein
MITIAINDAALLHMCVTRDGVAATPFRWERGLNKDKEPESDEQHAKWVSRSAVNVSCKG